MNKKTMGITEQNIEALAQGLKDVRAQGYKALEDIKKLHTVIQNQQLEMNSMRQQQNLILAKSYGTGPTS